MDEKLLMVIDLVAQLREAMREVDAVLFLRREQGL